MKSVKKRIFLVDDHPMIREGTARVINLQPDLMLCGAVGTATEALGDIPKAKPDVVIVDLSLEGRSGLELIKCLRASFPKIPVVVYTMHEEVIYAQRAIADGACDYVTKREPAATLMNALRHAADPTTGRPVMPLGRKKTVGAAAATSPIGRLTDRELEVFELRGQGMSTTLIAAHLHLSRKTVDAHFEHIKHKLNVANARELLTVAVSWMQSK